MISHGLVVRAEGSHPRGHGFKSRCILEGLSKATYIEKKIKVAKWEHTNFFFFLNFTFKNNLLKKCDRHLLNSAYVSHQKSNYILN